jgi:acyl-CoA synthetase (AMP-forming)/AMP-acid ligase II
VAEDFAALEVERQRLRAGWQRSGWHRGVNIVEAIHDGIEARRTDRIRFVGPGHAGQMTLGELTQQGSRIASVLHATGVRPGDAIAVHVPNWPEAARAIYAATLLRAVLVPIPSIYRPAEVKFILEDAKVKTYIVADNWRGHDYLADLPKVTDAAGLERVIVIGDSVPSGCLSWSEVEARALTASATPVGAHHVPGSDLALVVYTSGSTSNPKGGRHSHDTMLADFIQGREQFARPGTHLEGFPGGHLGGFMGLMRPLIYGMDTVILDRWDAEAAADLVHELKVTSMMGPPFYLSTLLDAAAAQGNQLDSIEDFSTGGTGVPTVLIERAFEAGFAPYRTYGMTEHPTITSNNPADTLEDRARTDGIELAGAQIRIVDDEDTDVPAAVEGQIVSRGPDQFLGYTSRGANEATFMPGGWFRTGDLGVITDRGRLVISGRKKDVIIRGGENLSAQEIEDILVRHPAVAEASVVGDKDPLYGERACAFVVLRSGADLSLDDVRAHFLASDVARQKTPERLIIKQELPRTAAGKVKKTVLRAELERAD